MTRASIGTNITGNPILTDRIVHSIGDGLTRFSTTDANVLFVKGIHIYQRGSAAKTLRIVKHLNDQLHSSNLSFTRWSNYNNAPTTNTENPNLIEWSAQPTAIDAPPLAVATLGPNFGDYVHITFDTPVEIVITTLTGDPKRCVGLQIGESGTYDLDVTWIFEFSHVI